MLEASSVAAKKPVYNISFIESICLLIYQSILVEWPVWFDNVSHNFFTTGSKPRAR
jgi:hypothetical protein